jgi:hypothetical protein
MELLYQGFDGLDVSFMGQISDAMCVTLEAAKEEAQRTHQSIPVIMSGFAMLVSESGAKGGYAFTASTGIYGATWFFKKPNARDPWGVRVSCNSFNLAINGLGRARAELHRILELLGITITPDGVSLSRIDYALDFLAPSFILNPDQFVMHSNANRADHIEHSEMSINGRSGRVTSVTVGKMPGRQVIVYDKRAEVIAKHKVGWWEIWNAAREQLGAPALDRDNPAESRIWRVELRAGKRHLKDDWSIRSWADLDNRLGDLIASTLDAIRYTQPTEDSNRSRWPDCALWEQVRGHSAEDLFEMRNFASPDLIKRVQLDAHDQLLENQMKGLLVSRAALRDMPVDQLATFAAKAGRDMASEISGARSRYEKKLAAASDRYFADYR